MIQETNESSVRWLVGNKPSNVRPLPPYHPNVCDFVSEFSDSLRANKEANKYPDIMSLAFWCRKSNINRKRKECFERYERLGLGLAFHVTPSNIPTNFAYSFLFGLLSGNANIVRVPSRAFPQTNIICSEINRVLASTQFSTLNEMQAFVSYDRNDEFTKKMCAICDVRVIWGGEISINQIKYFPIHGRCIDITFSDRYSFCVLSTDAIERCDNKQLSHLAKRFYNDTYLMDQDACSSPRLIVWLGGKNKQIRDRFWSAVYNVVRKTYSLEYGSVVNKFTKFCQDAMSSKKIDEFTRRGNEIYCLSLTELPTDLDEYSGKWGYFYEYETDDLSNMADAVTKKFQTLTYFGVEKKELGEFVVKHRLLGIDRIVPVGQGLEMDVIWDGIDVIHRMSRIVSIT